MNQFIGHFHPLIVHLPIGILLLAILFTFLSAKERFNGLKAAVPISFLLGAIGATLSCITGYLLSQSGDYEGDTVQNHQYLGIATAILSFIAYYLTRTNTDKPFTQLSKISAFALAGLLTFTGHLGGNLTHGSDYLFNFSDKTPKDVKSNTPPQYSEQSIVYQDIIQPILKEKCVSCHNESKQKGKLRLDNADFLQKGGENGAIFVAGNPDESEMIKRFLLPLDHKEHMPPKEKPQLTEEEKRLLRWWIEQGADFHKTVKDYPNFNQIAGKNDKISTPSVSYIPEVTIGQPDKLAIEGLQKMNIVALPIGKESPFLSVNFINNTNISSAKPHVQKLSKNIIWLKMGDSTIVDSCLTILSNLENLTKLYLDRTNMSDAGLKMILPLKNLVFLNLVGTKVTKEGVLTLKDLPKLKRLFLYQTAIKQEDFATLQAQLPHVQIDFGNYQVPILNSDTTEVKPPVVK